MVRLEHPAAVADRSATSLLTREPGPGAPRTPRGEDLRDRLAVELAKLEAACPADPVGMAARARSVLERARAADLAHEAGRARIVLADLGYRGDDVRSAAASARQVLAEAHDAGDDLLAARAEVVLAWCLNRLGALGESLGHAVTAVRLLPESAPGHLRVLHTMALALFSSMQATDDAYLAAFDDVTADVEGLDHPDLLVLVLNNYAWIHHLRGRSQEALSVVERIQRLYRDRGVPRTSTVLDTVATVLLECGQLAAAEQVARATVDGSVAEIEARGRPEALLTLARIEALRGRTGSALEHADAADALARQRGLPEVVAAAGDRASELLAELGDFQAAYTRLREAHQTWQRIRDERAEERASALHAVLETDQARRRGEAMAELAERDALTGLWNRRHVDRVLGGLLCAAREVPGPVSVAILDLDHFKRVNDTCSHQAGDAVLARLGALLTAVVGGSGLLARIGGEEFLLAMPGTGQQDARELCQTVRRAVVRHDFSDVTGGLPVTVSIGCTTVSGTARVSAALHDADEALYDAKHAGRNRVRCRPDPSADVPRSLPPEG